MSRPRFSAVSYCSFKEIYKCCIYCKIWPCFYCLNSELYQTSMMECFVKIFNTFQPFTNFGKCSILDVWQGYEYVTVKASGQSNRLNSPFRYRVTNHAFQTWMFLTPLWRTIKNSRRAGSEREDRLEKIITKWKRNLILENANFLCSI